MERLSYLTETVLSNMITRNRIVLSLKDSPRKPLRRRPINASHHYNGSKLFLAFELTARALNTNIDACLKFKDTAA